MMIELSAHRITNIAVDTPSVDHNWIQLTAKDVRGEEFEVTLFLQQSRDKNTTLYDFLHELRDSTEQAIKELISVQQSQSED